MGVIFAVWRRHLPTVVKRFCSRQSTKTPTLAARPMESITVSFE